MYVKKVSMLFNNQGVKITITPKTPIILGTAANVCSWTEETAWNKLIQKPIERAVISRGKESVINKERE